MNSLKELIFGKQQSVQGGEQQSLESILEKENYIFTELDEDEDLKHLGELEIERVKPWRKEGFKNELNFYLAQKYNKKVNVSNRYAAKIYKKMYEENILYSPTYNMIDKISLHPDLTIFDNDYIADLRKRQFKYAVVGQLLTFITIYAVYKRVPTWKINKSFIFVAIAPGISLFGTYQLVNLMNQKRITKLGLDKKYGVGEQKKIY